MLMTKPSEVKPIASVLAGDVVRSAPVVDDVDLRWHVLLTEPSCEMKAERNLRAQGFSPYVPMEVRSVVRTQNTRFGVRRVRVREERPIFRGYLFMPLNMAWSFGPIYSTRGLRQNGHPFLMVNGHHAIISGGDIARIRQAEAELSAERPLKAGDQVRLLDGPLRGFAMTINKLDDNGRIELLMNLLGKATKVYATSEQIERT